MWGVHVPPRSRAATLCATGTTGVLADEQRLTRVLGMTGDAGGEHRYQGPNLNGDSGWESVGLVYRPSLWTPAHLFLQGPGRWAGLY